GGEVPGSGCAADRYLGGCREGDSGVALAPPDTRRVAAVFCNAAEVNQALRALAGIIQKHSATPRGYLPPTSPPTSPPPPPALRRSTDPPPESPHNPNPTYLSQQSAKSRARSEVPNHARD